MNHVPAYTSIETPPVNIADLSLDKWRPTTFDKFVAGLTDAAFYEADHYVPPTSICFDLEGNSNAIVWCTCCDIQHTDNGDVAMMSPEFLVLTSYPNDSDQRRYLCFVRT